MKSAGSDAANRAARRGAWRPAQLAGAGVALVVLVFAVTFVVNYLDTGGPAGTTDGPAPLQLAFAETTFPASTPPLTAEVGQGGLHDFAFRNDNPEPVRLGLSGGCSCSSVDVFLVPDGWSAGANGLALVQAGRVAAAAGGVPPLLGLLGDSAAEGRFRELEGRLTVKHLDNHADPATNFVTVPAGAAGWVRLGWKGQLSPEPKGFKADLWSGQSSNPTPTLRVNVLFRNPLLLAGPPQPSLLEDRRLAPLKQSDLPYRLDILCWSPTRAHVTVKAELVGVPGGDDAFEVGAAVQTPEDVLSTLRDRARDDVRSEYRVPVTIHRPAATGQRSLAYGPFARRIKVWAEEGGEPLTVVVHGFVRPEGDTSLECVNLGEDGVLPLGEFSSQRGKTAHVDLRTRTTGPRLEVDRERTARFLEATLPAEPTVEEGKWAHWDLTVKVKPGEDLGRFPDFSDPRLRDSAVYVRPVGGGWSYRIPVTGNATSGGP